MSKKKTKEEKIAEFGNNLVLLAQRGFKPVPQRNCWWHYKDGVWNFYPTTGKYYNEDTKESGHIRDL